MKRDIYDWYIKGAYDWSIKSWNPPVDSIAFIHYCNGWDEVFPEEDIYYGFNDFPNFIMKTKKQQRIEKLKWFAFADGMVDWINRSWNPPRHPELFKEYSKGWDYVFGEEYTI
jgi:hypothetical protein